MCLSTSLYSEFHRSSVAWMLPRPLTLISKFLGVGPDFNESKQPWGRLSPSTISRGGDGGGWGGGGGGGGGLSDPQPPVVLLRRRSAQNNNNLQSQVSAINIISMQPQLMCPQI